MAKGPKSSASPATQKKHARRAAAAQGLPLPKQKKPKDKGKGKNKEPRKKVYIPPFKPAPVQPDPLEALGIASQLPPELVIVFRKLAKKDTVTKGKALEELKCDWVGRFGRGADDGGYDTVEAKLFVALPVWMHHLPLLFLHPNRKLRLLTASIHLSLLQVPSLLEQVIYFLKEAGSETQVDRVLGSWCMAAQDVDRAVALQSRRSFELAIVTQTHSATGNSALVLDNSSLSSIVRFVRSALYHPLNLYGELNPVQSNVVPKPQPGSRKGSARQAPPLVAKKKADDLQTRTKPEDEEESEEDRRGRLRVGALGAIRWMLESRVPDTVTLLSDLLTKSTLWTGLYHAEKAPFHSGWGESLGYKQPPVRKVTWMLLNVFLKFHIDEIERILPLLSQAVLRSAWVEPDINVIASMWQPLLLFLTKFPKAWDWDGDRVSVDKLTTEPNENEDDESDDESEDDDDGSKDEGGSVHSEETSDKAITPGYLEFLGFLQLGCSGAPVQGYPTVVVIISTIPPSILGSTANSLSAFFASFWAALDARALSSLDRVTSSAAFLSSLLECLVFLTKRWSAVTRTVGSSTETTPSELRDTIEIQLKHVMERLAARSLRVEGSAAGKYLGGMLQSLEAMDQALFSAAWSQITSTMTDSIDQKDPAAFNISVLILKSFDEQFKDESRARKLLSQLIRKLAGVAMDQSITILHDSDDSQSQSSGSLTALTDLLSTFPPYILQDDAMVERLDGFLKDDINAMLAKAPSLLMSYFAHRNEESVCSDLWYEVLSTMSADPVTGRQRLLELLPAAEKNLLPSCLKPQEDELDHLAAQIVEDAVSGRDGVAFSIARQLMQYPDRFLSRRASMGLIHNIVYTFSERTRRLLHDSTLTLESSELEAPLDLLQSIVVIEPGIVANNELRMFLPDFYIFGFLFPRSVNITTSPEPAFKFARQIWSATLLMLNGESMELLTSSLKGVLRDIILDLDCRPTPSAVIKSVSEDISGFQIDILRDIFPSMEQLEDILQALPSTPLDSTLAIIQPLIPSSSSLWEEESATASSYDSVGLSEYARVVNAILALVIHDRQVSRQNIWLLHHFVVLSIAAQEYLQVPGAKSAFFAPFISHVILHGIVAQVQKITTFILSTPTDDEWHAAVVKTVMQGRSRSNIGAVGDFVASLLIKAQVEDTIRDSLVIYMILQHLFNEATKDDADRWLELARSIEKNAPQTSLAIVYAITKYAPEPPRLDRYRNESAAGILGIPPSRANTDGLLLLRRFAATAPDPDSDIVFLLQSRAVNFMRQCQQWITSDEDMDEEVECEMTLIFFHLAPILQNVLGAHWDLIFDMIENNLENCSFDDPSTLVLLARTLNLLIAVQELAIANKALRQICFDRALSVLGLVKDLVIKSTVSSHSSAPRTICWELALSIVKDLPSKLIDHNTLPSMCHLLLDPSVSVQKMAYSLLEQAAGPRTEFVVVEAGVEAGSESKPELPAELLNVIKAASEQVADEQKSGVFGFLLAWMIVFDLFKDASLKVKMGYANQLRDMELIDSSFIPNVLDLLDVYKTRPGSFSLDIWNVEEYYVQLYDSESSFSPKLLAAHLFYRALLNIPSLIANWWIDCKDLTLSRSVVTLTGRHFSPLLVAAELAHVRGPSAAEELSGENWRVKVSLASNEVSAEFSVDDQQLEIAVRLPKDYPLHPIEVRDVRRVGVEEEKWRGWLLAVRQIVSLQNGGIVDGLSIFKKNVTHHFENQTECAICYSIISVTELALPKQKCRTCKNKFHSSCLYKWFNTSHTSACPLCRSDMV